ncbi:type II toxin-antitoxin system VapC family toxin [Deltaproteobacteria bacterium PRO3]|nr:type II toxin-antitoxin system VapC family toxin [Deltaproteobacteria bacterium PRO3]
MAKKTEAYVDTSALIAFLDRSDSYHSLFVGLFSDPPRILTTSLVIAEGHGWFLKRYDAFRALQFMAFIEELRSLEIVEVGQKQLADATKVLRRFSDQDLTLADACGLSLMEKRKIRRCWSTDFHLGLTGVPLIIHA